MSLVFSPEPWFVAQVIPHHEKKVNAILGLMSYEHFLPIHQTLRQWSDRIKLVEEPLFPGYVFVRIRRSLVGAVLSLPGVIRIVSFRGAPSPVTDEEIGGLQLICQSKRHVCSFPYLNIGDKVRVVAGPLSGLTGIIVRSKKNDRLIISVDLIMKSISVEVDLVEVSPLRPEMIA